MHVVILVIAENEQRVQISKLLILISCCSCSKEFPITLDFSESQGYFIVALPMPSITILKSRQSVASSNKPKCKFMDFVSLE